MIQIQGSAQRSFIFPAEIQTAINYYRDVSRILHYLPHISVVEEFTPTSFRMLFSSTEAGVYRVNIYCDLFTEYLEDERAILITPLNGMTTPVASQAGIYSLVTHGYYSSKSTFHPEEGNTRVEYQLEIHADLPVPLGVRLVPESVLEAISNSITRWRIEEIAGGFVERSLNAYRQSVGRPAAS